MDIDKQATFANDLRSFARLTLWLIAVLGGALAVCLAILFFRPTYQSLYAKAPRGLQMESLSYFDVGIHSPLLREAPFVEAIAIFLKDEAKAAGGATQIFVAQSRPIEHPTTRFGVSLQFDPAHYQVSGYAFVRHGMGEQSTFAPLQVRYGRDDSVSFTVPPTRVEDRLMFIGRMTARGKPEFLPLESQLKLVIHDGRE